MSLLQLRRLIHIFVCFIAGLVPLVSAERWHIVITFLPQKPVAGMGMGGNGKVVDGHTARALFPFVLAG